MQPSAGSQREFPQRSRSLPAHRRDSASFPLRPTTASPLIRQSAAPSSDGCNRRKGPVSRPRSIAVLHGIGRDTAVMLRNGDKHAAGGEPRPASRGKRDSGHLAGCDWPGPTLMVSKLAKIRRRPARSASPASLAWRMRKCPVDALHPVFHRVGLVGRQALREFRAVDATAHAPGFGYRYDHRLAIECVARRVAIMFVLRHAAISRSPRVDTPQRSDDHHAHPLQTGGPHACQTHRSQSSRG